ncbi:DUF4174 domain-containing protein [Mycolicibacterium sp. P1-18]|uniref:DUF4174 domain-containing protein n=1 Tax=Mycolicibacterium sp. P1-18 TaxID=2024615 RepID=UPI0011F20579|nr:DUF4174 domain-containing protein [Mycolicibacterium sp. P1-18]KAA0100061.1 DUF4174 domain-containing protein [Mycolicibacterium sp. P1-18]
MATKRGVLRLALVLIGVVVSTILGSVTAAAAELGDYRWERRPLLVFAPKDDDPRLVETLRRVDASRCDFVSRDMVLGVVVAQGNGTLDGQALDAGQSRRLMSQFGIDEDAFGVVLIGKDGGEKWRTNQVPDVRTIYDVVDGMPMRSREMNANRGPC